MTTYQILCLIGIPTLIGMFLTYLIRKVHETATKTTALEKGVQALLRDRLYQSYNHYHEKGYAPLYARDNFENMYMSYHNLGSNGVMDEYHERFKELPTEIE